MALHMLVVYQPAPMHESPVTIEESVVSLEFIVSAASQCCGGGKNQIYAMQCCEEAYGIER